MCGRYCIIDCAGGDPRLFRYAERPNFPPRYNVAPTQPMPIVRHGRGRAPVCAGALGPDPGLGEGPEAISRLLINARGESVNDKPAFRNAMKRRRCLFPADGFYEWKTDGRGKRAYFARPPGGGPLAFAGLWETWTGPNGEEMDTAAIVTTQANAAMAQVHHRTPVIIAPEAFDLWLDCSKVDEKAAAALLGPAPPGLDGGLRGVAGGQPRHQRLARTDRAFQCRRRGSRYAGNACIGGARPKIAASRGHRAGIAVLMAGVDRQVRSAEICKIEPTAMAAMRVLLIGLLAAILALPAHAQQGRSRTGAEPAKSQAVKGKTPRKQPRVPAAPTTAPRPEPLYDTEKAMR